MVTGPTPGARENPAPRVTKCQDCGRQIAAGARGPLPRRCAECRGARQLDVEYRVATALKTAVQAGAPDAIVKPLRVAKSAAQEWTRFGQ